MVKYQLKLAFMLVILFTSGSALALAVNEQNNTNVVQPGNNFTTYSSSATKSISILNNIKDIIVKGKVTESNGTALEGVSVKVEGADKGAITNANGEYTIDNVPDNATLLFSSVGFTTARIPVSGRTIIDIVLNESNIGLNEVIIVGYGQERKANLIGTVSQITSKDIEDRPVTQLSNALTGQMPGVTVIQRSGRPGFSAGDINIRGVGSFGADASPLVLVDGIPVNSYNDVDPNDVASISVLKDASSAAIYGARAANGVILVTTKSGKAGKLQVSYRGYVGVQKATELPQLVPSWQYAQLYNEASGREVYTVDDIQKYKDGSDPDNYPNNNFLKSTLTGNGIQTGHNISVNGGSEKNRYMLSIGYLNQNGIVPKNWYERYNFRLNMTSEISSTLHLTTRLSGIQNNIHEPASPAQNHATMLRIIGESLRMQPILAGKFSNGDYGVGIEQKGTPVSWLESDAFFKSNNMDINANLRLDWKVVPGLTLSLLTAYEKYNDAEKTFLASQVLNQNITVGPSNLTQANTSFSYKTLQGLAEYKKSIQMHNFDLLAGYSFEDKQMEDLSGFRDNFPGNALTVLDVGAPNNQQSSGSGSEWAIQSLFGRFKYDYANRFLFNAVVRYDGSSRFPPTQKYGLFPSIAAGWRLSEEKFMKNKFSWLQDLKLKASIGVLGNQNIPNYPYQSTLVNNYIYSFGGNPAAGIARAVYVDSTLHWESTRTEDVGLDLSILNGMISFSADYFNRFTDNILYSPSSSVSSILGLNVSKMNSGKLINSGWEFTISHKNHIKKLKYNFNANFSIINNKVQSLGVGNITQPNGLIGNGSDLFIGYPIGIYYGYVADGLFVDGNDVKNWADETKVNPKPQPGDIRYKDISGPDGKPDGKVDPTYDRRVIGSTIPKYTFGLSLGFNYKAFDLSALIQGVAGVKGMLDNTAGFAFYNTAGIQQWMANDHWSPQNPNPNAKYPRLEILGNSGTPNTIISSHWILDASYVRVRNIQFGYTLAKRLTERMRVTSTRFYVSAENFFTWKQFRKGWDPETSVATSKEFYPILGSFTFGVNLNF